MEDAWKPGADAPAVPTNAEGLPKVMDLLSLCFKDLSNHFAPLLFAGLGMQLVMFPLVFVSIFIVYGSMIPGVVMEDPLVMIVGLVFGMLAMMGLLFIATAPLTNSLTRSMWAYVEHNELPGFGASFSRMFENLGTMLLLMAVQAVLVTIGLMMCYVPALFVGMAFSFAVPAVVVHNRSMPEAVGQSFGHMKSHFVWHLGFYFLGLAIVMVGSQIPIIGPAISLPLYYLYQFRAYREIFGAGPEPKLVQAEIAP